MIFRKSMFILLFFCLLFPLCADENQASLYLDKIEYKGNNRGNGKRIRELIESEIQLHHMFEIVDAKNDAEYILECSVYENGSDVKITMEITGTVSSLRETVVRDDTDEIGLRVLLQEAVEYIHTKVFPYEMYVKRNQSYFTAREMRKLYNQDVVDRTRDRGHVSSIVLFDPLKKKLFDTYRIQIFPSGGLSFPMNMYTYDVYQRFHFNLPIHVYLYNSEIFMISLIAEGFFIPYEKQIDVDQFNYLKIWGFGGGVGICFPLPFYEKIGLHLNVCGGWSVSVLTSEAYADRTLYSNDPFIHPSFEIEHTITDHVSIAVKASYIWISYIESAEDMHILQAGIGLGIRF
jgi:hypothetical protein